MADWNIERHWKVADNVGGLLETSQLAQHDACIVFGAAGLGKTYELSQLAKSLEVVVPDERVLFWTGWPGCGFQCG